MRFAARGLGLSGRLDRRGGLALGWVAWRGGKGLWLEALLRIPAEPPRRLLRRSGARSRFSSRGSLCRWTRLQQSYAPPPPPGTFHRQIYSGLETLTISHVPRGAAPWLSAPPPRAASHAPGASSPNPRANTLPRWLFARIRLRRITRARPCPISAGRRRRRVQACGGRRAGSARLWGSVLLCWLVSLLYLWLLREPVGSDLAVLEGVSGFGQGPSKTEVDWASGTLRGPSVGPPKA